MQFNIPQFIEVEDKIIGPLTLKQFLFLAAGGAILFIAWFFLKLWAFLVLAIPIGLIAVVLAFYRVNGRPFIAFIGSLIGYLTKPRLYIWRKK
ncbi:MAG: hypothetical protein A3I88_01880 [Candidatus Portnoybacteria bacterium RIFCSPLOWO2_12_FULL_39_9]|uniref:PrgI family protein n=1 Tax=Candidatus Portnoybacteria bacterium RIFCSPHIGHO2_12_FULL_38_9 TaxID=1801997 RepID=A0A1G2FIQ2_9BACT|nr:MAG: hypothetical protein A3H00_03125 [Candidatus Portnoybacteria bacterium RBG_13_40_8]OGZ36564.1 MAG: hypothetical protein A2646_00060 [Candidatus Portnoybacteria bacterium RIFCSPHIGHO2_02_FULL_39_12]OGZ37458.1 MAG: hypothetical protein A3J64_00485 [Candidatus Portnoybacteria bacterium RIFCSPHIGHO2_12_FULL_38_9]OGZ39104.1 MAG: hypothetical protein A3F21_00060 [Candidatus Portnoybacteria bacterium RIFCSPLOWO2_01_FULL_38_39]OGZ40194.1 MAG: hypothetical protein A3I88_01880 [Candidatus Portnoy